LFLAVACLTLAADQASKWVILNHLPEGRSWPPADHWIAKVFTFAHVRNTGVALGMFQGRNSFFLGLAVVVAAGLWVFQRRTDPTHRLVHLAVGLQVGGAIGNMIDRVRLGHVVDFLSFKIFWPVFNVADAAIVMGVVLLMVHFWQAERRAEAATSAADPSPPTRTETA
jgi:signal peptidase II